MGVALSVYNSFTKLFNMPLLAVVTSSTANALGRGHADDSPEVGAAVASALALALAIGLLQAALLGIGGMAGLGAWGAGGESPLHGSAAAYLTVRALSAPATVFFLALQGVFRGLGDTRAPFYATLVSNALNVVLEPIFIFVFGWGVRGAATAIAVAQVASCGVLIYLLQKRLSFKGMDAGALSGAWEHVRPTGLLIIRS